LNHAPPLIPVDFSVYYIVSSTYNFPFYAS